MIFNVVLLNAGPNPNAAALALGKLLELSVKERRKRLDTVGGIVHSSANRSEVEAIVWALQEAGAAVEIAEVAAPVVEEGEAPAVSPVEALTTRILEAADLRVVLETVENCEDASLLSKVLDALIASGKAPPNTMAVVSDRIRTLLRPKPGEEGSTEVLSMMTRNLEVALTEAEKHAAADEVVEGTARIEELKSQAKNAADSFKARITMEEDKRRDEIRKRQTGKEWRLVEIRVVFDLARDRVRLVRQDTDEVVEERMPTEAERQRPLFGRR